MKIFGYSGLPGEELLAAMDAEELAAWENQDVPSIDRASDRAEARSVDMMRRGRRRLAADSRLVFRDDARFVTATGQALPLASES